MAKICRRTGKRNFRSQNGAESALRVIAAGDTVHTRFDVYPIRTYKCTQCPYWHLTSEQKRS